MNPMTVVGWIALGCGWVLLLVWVFLATRTA